MGQTLGHEFVVLRIVGHSDMDRFLAGNILGFGVLIFVLCFEIRFMYQIESNVQLYKSCLFIYSKDVNHRNKIK